MAKVEKHFLKIYGVHNARAYSNRSRKVSMQQSRSSSFDSVSYSNAFDEISLGIHCYFFGCERECECVCVCLLRKITIAVGADDDKTGPFKWLPIRRQ